MRHNANKALFFYKELIKITKITRQELSPEVNSSLTKADEAETTIGAQAKVDALAGEGNTKTVKQLDDEVATHEAKTTAHGATSSPTANRIVLRDNEGALVGNSAKVLFAPTDSTTSADDYPKGVSYSDVATSAGFPVTGTLITVNHSNIRCFQILNEHGSAGLNRQFRRVYHSTGGGWSDWEETVTINWMQEVSGFGTTNPRQSTNLNNEVNNGRVYAGTSTANRPPEGVYFVVDIYSRLNTRVSQVAYNLDASNDGKPAVWIRKLDNGGWGAWQEMGGSKIIRASNTVVAERLDEVGTLGSDNIKLIMKHIPKGTGEAILKLDGKSTDFYQTTYIIISTNSGDYSIVGGKAFDWRTPIDTVMLHSDLNSDYIETTIKSNDYKPHEMSFYVNYGVPIYIFMGTSSSGSDVVSYVKNMRICYE